MRKCINGHIGFGGIRRCKKCGEILIAGKNWRKGKISPYVTYLASKAYKITMGKRDYVLRAFFKEENQQMYDNAKKEFQMLNVLLGCDYIERIANGKIDNNTVYILKEHNENILQNKDSFSKRNIAKLGQNICQALIKCRENRIYHLDINPQNLYVDKDGKYLLGGFQTAIYREHLKKCKEIKGALEYMAPEVYHHQQYLEQSQIYSLGLVLYYLLNGGCMPFLLDKNPGSAVHRRLSGEAFPPIADDDWMNFINKACAFNYEERFATLEECLEALKKIPIKPEAAGE